MKAIVIMLRNLGVEIDPQALQLLWDRMRVEAPKILDSVPLFLSTNDARLKQLTADVACLKEWAVSATKALESIEERIKGLESCLMKKAS